MSSEQRKKQDPLKTTRRSITDTIEAEARRLLTEQRDYYVSIGREDLAVEVEALEVEVEVRDRSEDKVYSEGVRTCKSEAASIRDALKAFGLAERPGDDLPTSVSRVLRYLEGRILILEDEVVRLAGEANQK